MKQTATHSPDGIPAATVVIFRHARTKGPNEGRDATGAPELLMVTRSRNLSFAGGAAVFPGGRVDPEDYELAAGIDSPYAVDETAHRIAAIRETLEETGLGIGLTGSVDGTIAKRARAMLLDTKALAPVLRALNLTIHLDAIHPFSRWFPKNEKLSRVFDTRFYLADLGTGAVDIAVDETENTKLYWITARQALDDADAGKLTIIYPTRRNLERLATYADFSHAAESCRTYGAKMITPFLEERDGERWLSIRDDAGYPVTGERLDQSIRG
ncbi:MAG: NUDIX domain-containing protein [Pontixanthobacter sp.]